ncbi:MAG: hypothetical protein ACNA8W_13015 [Bradymonadaceae bacterium]
MNDSPSRFLSLVRFSGLTIALCAGVALLVGCDSPVPEQAPPSVDKSAEESVEESAAEPAVEPAAAKPVKTLDDLPEGINVVQHEMQLLTAAMQNILRHIADDNLAAVPLEIGKVHPVYELTHEAIEKGLYRPPFNPDQIEEFKAMDDAFHNDLVALVRASRGDDLQVAATTYGKLVEGCTGCHAQFRFAPPAQ